MTSIPTGKDDWRAIFTTLRSGNLNAAASKEAPFCKIEFDQGFPAVDNGLGNGACQKITLGLGHYQGCAAPPTSKRSFSAPRVSSWSRGFVRVAYHLDGAFGVIRGLLCQE